jgi:hypothetical protein
MMARRRSLTVTEIDAQLADLASILVTHREDEVAREAVWEHIDALLDERLSVRGAVSSVTWAHEIRSGWPSMQGP